MLMQSVRKIHLNVAPQKFLSHVALTTKLHCENYTLAAKWYKYVLQCNLYDKFPGM